MRGSLKVGRIAGITVEVHYTWLFVFALVTYLLANGMSELVASAVLAWAIAMVTSLAFFGAVLAHELAHSLVANSYGEFVERITLFAFGGVAHLNDEPPSGTAELWIALAGPGMSLALAGVFGGGVILLKLGPPSLEVAHFAFLYLAVINLILALFNMTPAYPLDGGRVLRAIIWIATGRFDRATRVAARIGQAFAWALMGYGMLLTLRGPGAVFNGLWMVAIGWMLSSGARGSLQRLAIESALSGVTVEQIMTTAPASAGADWSLQRLVYEVILPQRTREVPITWGGQTLGVVNANAVQRVPQANWPVMSVTQVMEPLNPRRLLSPDAPATEALKVAGGGLGPGYVVDAYGALLGIVTEQDLLHAIQIGAWRQQGMAQEARIGRAGGPPGYVYPVPPATPTAPQAFPEQAAYDDGAASHSAPPAVGGGQSD